jgi:septal ring factor EnvC (AmiA/AmiB activator)
VPDAPVQDLVVEQLKLLRGDVQGLRGDVNARLDQTNARLDQTNARLDQTNARLETVETTLRDLAQQMVMLTRAVHVTLEQRRDTDRAIDDLRARVEALESRQST